MTYRELAAFLSTLSEEQLNMDVTVYDTQQDEYFMSAGLSVVADTDVLDDNHPVITFI